MQSPCCDGARTEYRAEARLQPHARAARRAEAAPRTATSFVVQKHARAALHYDFRLELDGVLLSWAVPEGPEPRPEGKRLAVQTEDHPLEYGELRGRDPEGRVRRRHGAGVGPRHAGSPKATRATGYAQGPAAGSRSQGEKLRGGWHLVRTRGARRASKRQGWLLFKGRDDEARSGREADDRGKPSRRA